MNFKNIKDKTPTWLSLFAAVIILAAGIYLLTVLSPIFLEKLGSKPAVEDARKAPDFALQTLDRQTVKLTDFARSKIIIIFWTSWNEASLEQLKILDEYVSTFKNDGVTVLAINSQESTDVANAIKNRDDINVNILIDADGFVGEKYKIGILPKTVFIDSGGLISSEIVGPYSLEKLHEVIKELGQ